MPTAKEIYDANIRHPHDHRVIDLFGYTSSQILDALEFWEINKMAMTRNDAEAKLRALCTPRDLNSDYHILNVLEALGLIKFEEEGIPIGFSFPLSKRDEWTACCDHLRRQGFKIIKA